MVTLAPPPRRAPDPVDPEALIEEARRRQRRRRIRLALAAAALLAAAGAGYGIDRAVGGGHGAAAPAARPAPVSSPFAGHGRLAYVSHGRLLVLDGSTGTVVRVTDGGSGSPAFSPDGRWLTYLVHGRVGLARSDGTDARTLSTRLGASWLPDGRLLAGRAIYRLAPDGAPIRVAPAPADLVAWAPDGSGYAFVTRRVAHGADGSFHGTERLELAASLTGPRTLWRSSPISFTRRGGFVGGAIDGVTVLPGGRGVLFSIDPLQSASLAADGLPVYELRSPGAAPRELGVVTGGGISVAAGGRVAIGAGPDRYAWRTKTVRTCSAATARCAAAPAPAGKLTLDPAWSPDGRTLAFVVASPETFADFTPERVAQWYATRRLWLLRTGASAPVQVPGTRGAAAPTWSADGTSLLFVRNDALWLVPRLDAKPVQVSGPLFAGAWPGSFGLVPWAAEFAWYSG